jgi:hypothetical protein
MFGAFSQTEVTSKTQWQVVYGWLTTDRRLLNRETLFLQRLHLIGHWQTDILPCEEEAGSQKMKFKHSMNNIVNQWNLVILVMSKNTIKCVHIQHLHLQLTNLTTGEAVFVGIDNPS